MFVKKLLDRASGSRKPTSGCSKGLKPEDVNPRIVFHYGVPAGANSLAYDSSARILAVSTRDGRIKLFGSGNTQALLESEKAVPSKFLQFVENRGILLNVRTDNNIEVWDLATKLCHVHAFQEEITSFTVLKQSLFMYIGDVRGNISILELETETHQLSRTEYTIPFSESHGRSTKATDEMPVLFILPKPMSDNKRVLIIFEDGIISLWEVPESKAKYVTGGSMMHTSTESRKVLSACWACPSGSKVAVGYSTGDIFLWNIPEILNMQNLTSGKEISSQSTPLLKLNLGYKADKVPVVSLRWISGSGSSSRLYVNGVSDLGPSHSFQVVILNENTESRTVKMVLPIPEACQAVEIISGFEHNKRAIATLVILLKSGLLCIYNDSEIEKYLLQCQSKSVPQLPDYVTIKLPLTGSSITTSKLIRENVDPRVPEEDFALMCRKFPDLFSTDHKEGNTSTLSFSSNLNTSNLYITGHQDGSINFWEASSPLLFPILSIKAQGENGKSVEDVCIKALYFEFSSKVLISGSASGLVNIYTFKKENSITGNLFAVIQAKQGCTYTTNSFKVTGSVLCISMNPHSNLIAIGTYEGYLSIVKMEGASVLYQKHFSSEPCTGIMSLQFYSHMVDASIKNVLMIGTEGSSFSIIEEDNGHPLTSGVISPKNISTALLMQIIDDKEIVPNRPLLLVCSEKAVRLYCLSSAMQDIKKVCYKKKLHGSCCWASMFSSPLAGWGIILLFDCGRIEIRSLPELNLLKETSPRGLVFSSLCPKAPNSRYYGSLCSSSDGELIMVRGNQEILFVSVCQKEAYRLFETINQVYKDNVLSPSGSTDRGKKKGLFSSVVREMTGSQGKKQGVEEESGANPAELNHIFSTCNYPVHVESPPNGSNVAVDELDIDDIDLDDSEDKTKGKTFAALNKELGKKFNAIKGKIKVKTIKNPEISAKEENRDEKSPNTIDDIKKRYGYPSSSDLNAAKQAQNKLHENLKKIQAIETKSSEMQNTARTFSSMARELLRVSEQEKKT